VGEFAIRDLKEALINIRISSERRPAHVANGDAGQSNGCGLGVNEEMV
jgi:hypothetical protein